MMQIRFVLFAALVSATAHSAFAQSPGGEPVPVTVDNFIRAESDRYLESVAIKESAFGRFNHHREVSQTDDQKVIRQNRDTLYSAAVFDLDAGPVTITLPDAGPRFMSMQIIDQDHNVPAVFYGAGARTLTRQGIGTRYVLVGIRTLVDPNDPEDLRNAHRLQDAVKVSQKEAGTFAVPKWDQVSQKKVRDALLVLATTLEDFRGAFGPKGRVDPVHHLIASAAAWGGNPDKDAVYLNVTPEENDGRIVYVLRVKDVPVDAFWSVSVYNAQGYFEKNPYNAYTLNNITAKTERDGTIDIQFGGCDGRIPNCLPTMPGWNYTVRLYRPRAEILSGKWSFPHPEPLLEGRAVKP